MIADLIMFLFVIIICSIFGIGLYIVEKCVTKHEVKEQRKAERKQRQRERREFERQVYQSEITLVLHVADVALRGLK